MVISNILLYFKGSVLLYMWWMALDLRQGECWISCLVLRQKYIHRFIWIAIDKNMLRILQFYVLFI